MNYSHSLTYYVSIFLVAGFLLSSCKHQTTGIEDKPSFMNQKTTTYILVRHAEKAGSDQDSPLLEEGMQRAERLANRFQNLPVKAVYSSDFTRTQQTAAPTAILHDLDVIGYDPAQLDTLAINLRELYKEGAVLVVGHSNTTPQLANLLSGVSHFEDFDESDYASYFVVICPENQPCIPLNLRD